ncbi:MAG: helix-turn-helix transcriptional regulator [Sterolibacterium sp.]
MLSFAQVLSTCGVRKATLARLAGVSRAALTRYEKGERQPELSIADRIAKLTHHDVIVDDGVLRFIPQKKRGRKAVMA